jgi:hypothetical protein
MKAAIIVFSDPKAGSDESLGRLFNALVTAHDFKQAGNEVTILFQGAGTRWAGEVIKPEHPAHRLYQSVADKVAGVSCGCADVFGATETAEKSGFTLLKHNALPGTPELPSVPRLVSEGFTVFTF